MPVFGKKVFTTTKKLNIKNLIHLITSTLCFKGAVTLLNLSVTSCQKEKRKVFKAIHCVYQHNWAFCSGELKMTKNVIAGLN